MQADSQPGDRAAMARIAAIGAVEPGDVVSGTATAILVPDASDPDARVEQVVDIAFRCTVTP